MRNLKLLTAAVFGLLLGIRPAHVAPITIHMGWVAPVANWGSIWLEKKDLARHFGQSYTVEPVHFSSSSAYITAIAAGDLQVADLAYSSFALAVTNAGIDDLRVIAGEFEDGVQGTYSDEFIVAKDSPISKIDDLKGKVLMTNGGGSAVDIAIRAMLLKHHIDPTRDVTFVEAPLPAAAPMVSESKVDLAPFVRPFSANPQARAKVRTLFTQREAIGVTQMLVLCARQAFIDKNHAAMLDFMEDTLRIVHWYLDPKNHDAAMAIAAKVTKTPLSNWSWLFTKNDNYRDPNMMPNLEALQRNVDQVKDLGLAPASFDVKAHSDLSLLKEAAARLKH
jgi:sulfonate transport system substrate-binding protein